MLHTLRIGGLALLMALALTPGCKKTSQPPTQDGFFKTAFQTESEFIVKSIVTDLAEQCYFAAHGQLPSDGELSVRAVEASGSEFRKPVYALEIQLDPRMPALNRELAIDGPIWSPELYAETVAAIATAVGWSPGENSAPADTALLARLLDARADGIEKENQTLSAALQEDFSNAQLHEQAALLLGAFALREHSGVFYEIRSPLCRMTAHLAMAAFLRGDAPPGINGLMADLILSTLMCNRAAAVEGLATLDVSDPAVEAMARALRARNSGDYRPLSDRRDGTLVEDLSWFMARGDYAGATTSWEQLSERNKNTVDFIRVANELSYSVEMGHDLLRRAFAAEVREVESVHALARGSRIESADLVKVLDALPERAFSPTAGTAARVCVIGWGQWAMFLQRHLCHAAHENFIFMYERWGVEEEAMDFAARCETQLGSLRLYPFVTRIICKDAETYQRSVDDIFRVTQETPQLVPSQCWNYLRTRVAFAPYHCPAGSSYVVEWHSHNPPPGTAYDLGGRLSQPNVNENPQVLALFEELHELAPYDVRVTRRIAQDRYNNDLTVEQAQDHYGLLLPYSTFALSVLAHAAQNQPETFEAYLLQAAELNPSYYYQLADHTLDRGEEDKAARFLEDAAAEDPDSVRVSNRSEWRVRYHLDRGEIDKAREIADFAAEVYSYRGLAAKGMFLERTGKHAAAFTWYARIEERYDNSGPLVGFCLRHKAATGDSRFDNELNRRLSETFPDGMQPAALGDFSDAPLDGVLIAGANNRLREAGLKGGDIIVALNGTRVRSMPQYTLVRDSAESSELDLIVWDGTGYRQVKASPPDRKFGVNFTTYGGN